MTSVIEILIVSSTAIAAQLLRRNSDGSWPLNPEPIDAGSIVELASIGLELPLREVYRDTYLAK